MQKGDETSSAATATPTDDESITTSTESETFETWTLVTDRNKIGLIPKLKSHSMCNRVEILSKDNDASLNDAKTQTKEEESIENAEAVADIAEEEQNQFKPCSDSTIDDYSDGISIISESDSGGRVSPHPYLRDQLNIKFDAGDTLEFPLPLPQKIPSNLPAVLLTTRYDNANIQKRRKRSTSKTSGKKLAEPPQAVETRTTRINCHVKRGLTGFFYASVAVALLAFIGKIRYPEWEPLNINKFNTDLEQKLADIELQNNLMRAEIDILSKQVNYLNNLNEECHFKSGEDNGAFPPQHQHQKHDTKRNKRRKEKIFKAWSGNGNYKEPVDISKRELKTPHKCHDGTFVQIADMCGETLPSPAEYEEPLIESIENIVNDFWMQSKDVNEFEKVKKETDELPEFIDMPFQKAENCQSMLDEENTKDIDEPTKTDAKLKILNENIDEHKRDRREEKYQKDYKQSSQKHEKYNANSKEHVKSGKHEKKSSEHEQKQRYNKHKHDDDDDDSDEDFGKRSTYDSKERFKKHDKPRFDDNNSKERQYRQRSKSSSGENFEKDGHWHDQLMQHRENVRRQNEQQQRNNKNWFFARGDSREKQRHR